MNAKNYISALIVLSLSTATVKAGSEDDGSTNNVYYGIGAGDNLTTSGFSNTLFGYQAGLNTTTGDENTFLGFNTGFSNTIGSSNTFLGKEAGTSNISGNNNTFSGFGAGMLNTTGSFNTFTGNAAGLNNTTGNNNTYSGIQAGVFNSTGSNNVFLGYTAGYNETGSNKLYIESDFDTYRTTPLIYGEFDTRLVGINGILGVGTQTPTSTLHVQSSDGSAQILVEETNASVAPRTLFELKNAGNTKFVINNTNAAVEWAFTNSGSDFRISRQGSGVVELALSNAGNLTIQGNLTELSSRSLKHHIVAMNPAQILTKVLALPINEWSYKDSLEGVRHIGPMAEDFHAAFGLGESPKGIATLDTSGVALAAIQGLKTEQDKALAEQDKKLLAKDAEILALKAEQAKKFAAKDAEFALLKAEQDKKLTSMQAELDELKTLIKLQGNK